MKMGMLSFRVHRSGPWAVILVCGVVAVACEDERFEPREALPEPGPSVVIAGTPAAEADSALLTVREGLQSPESALHDPLADVYLLSNVNGKFTAKDNNGFISRISPDGRVAELKWIEGGEAGVTLHGPAGITISGDTLFVADVDAVRLFGRQTGSPLGEWRVPGAVFLNDLSVGSDGAVYVTDTAIRPTPSGEMEEAGTDAVYRIDRSGSVSPVARDEALQRPNGVIATPEGVLVATFGADEIYRLGSDGNRTRVATLPMGQLDGLLRLPDGSLLVSSWKGKAVYRVGPGGDTTTVLRNATTPAGLGHDAARNRLLVPMVNLNRLVIQPLPGSR